MGVLVTPKVIFPYFDNFEGKRIQKKIVKSLQ